MVDSTEHDDMLFAMLKECKTLPVFLNHIFGFLKRRTDFYHITNDPHSPVGFPPGLAEQVVKQTFHKWQPSDKPPPETAPPFPSPPPPAPQKPNDGFAPSDYYNGAAFDTYSWSQSLLEVDVTVRVPEGATAKDLTVTIQSGRISVRSAEGALLEGELCDRIKQKEAIWSVENGKLDVHLDKCKERWWDCLVKSEPRLDVRKLDCSRPFEELPEEAQAKIEELQWNQERKRLGLPTSDEMAMQSMLKRSWDVEGSPFSGPFDPNAVKFN